ncbi:hypothetical protein QC761_0095860 [Podospora bellae-mahoneyi]|uniref:Uncharacterized protein n=1 Tax=Podospora bellae-mahoneyi TaxID=2093777 RepID=A0ABR0FA02_9PEZI|nr:hypothetical protein QC761_0095860 [Podospora bellae-mahoneyi]
MTPPPMGAGDLFPGCLVSKYAYKEWDVDGKDTITIEGAKWERHRYGQVWFRFSLSMDTDIFNMVTKSLDLPGELGAIRKLLATADLLVQAAAENTIHCNYGNRPWQGQPVVAPSGASSNTPDASGSRADVVPADTAAGTTALTAEKKLEKAEKGLEKVVEKGDRLKSNSERQAKQITALNYAQVKLRNENAKLKEERAEAQNTKKKLEREAKDHRGKNAVLEEDQKAEEDRQQEAREEEDMRQKMLDAREQSFCEWERLLEQRER